MFNAEPSEGKGMALLPRELFWLVLKHLEPGDVIRCRRVCKSWNVAFRVGANLLPMLKRRYPLAKEVRQLDSERAESLETAEFDTRVSKIFDHVTTKYDHRSRLDPQTMHKYKLCDEFGITGERNWFPVQPWEFHASQYMQIIDRSFGETFWSYEDGLLVYPSADHSCLVLMDLETDRQFMVPFIIVGKVIRRVRLQKRVLVIEWAENKAFHWLNDSDGVHRHFATSFDVNQKDDDGWSVNFRNEWKIMFLGHPLSERDRFYSTHSKTHYAIYIWQPNRSLYTADEDAPIESLSVWDISKPSSYRPSLDPTGRLRVESEEEDPGPTIISRFGFRELDFYGVRQRGLPAMQSLNITDDDQSIEIFEGTLAGRAPWVLVPNEWASEVWVTTIPIVGEGPCWRRSVDFALPVYRGNCSLQTNPITNAICDGPWYSILCESYDEQAKVGYCLYLEGLISQSEITMFLAVSSPDSAVVLPESVVTELTGMGKIYGTEDYVIGQNHNRELVIFRFDR
ncbi:hypothetical protein AbraIFM66951_003793 [Aspergillus brasiliensis]|uniref:F-box domain-containing protein n=1 Tax=Aspergillus brasiliensis TaxID=319629 RepID=A0A9W5YKG7_9EURO|nr:hypothetical protein AbraCBS73388_003102 [Aspergillus brasiliensis]GKZ50533.1 hypothetical protein AbraIFM66951_003793 [Aspergillus brasiliensis]